MTEPERGFPRAEFVDRTAGAQTAMARQGLAALFLTTPQDIQYITGFLTRFWESPTRPWYVIVPASGDPVAVIPGIGAHLMGQGWVTDIRTWAAPDYDDDGIGLLAETIAELVPPSGAIGVPSAMESHLRMPLADWERLKALAAPRVFRDDALILRHLRMVKSPREIDRIRAACAIADRAFARVPEIAREGVPLSQVFRHFQMLCLDEGADWVSYLAGASARGGYGDVISPASDRPLAAGDVLMLDTGLVRDGYFCDFDRNFAIGHAAPETRAAHTRLLDATSAAFSATRPGATAADLFHAMAPVLGLDGAGGGGRLGHGLGLNLTEWPSLIPDDHTVLEPGMVLTLEPGIETGPGRMLVHEENIVVTETGADWLSTPAADLPVI